MREGPKAPPLDVGSWPPEISVVVPAFNEGANIDLLLARLLPVLEEITPRWEVIFVNDGSRDDTITRILTHQTREARILAIDLTRNFGKDIALTAGLDCARGAAVIPMDADLQHPPEVIPELVARWRDGYDVVTATHRRRTDESLSRRAFASMFYGLLRRISNTPIPNGAGDFRLLARPVVDAIKRLPERTRFMKGLVAWVGFSQTAVQFDRESRQSGNTRWNFWRLWNFALDGIFAFSSLPLKVWGYIGLAIALPSLLYALYLLARTLVQGADVPGYASLIVGILFLGGIQLISLGIIGEYLARVYDEVKARPLYLVRNRYGFEDQAQREC